MKMVRPQMNKIKRWFSNWFNKQVEKSFQRKADRMFRKAQKKRRTYE